MSVHYKFKSALDFDTISFDSLNISVSDLKKAIIHQKRLGKTCDFDLQITNAQTKEEYAEDACLIPKNTSLIIARIPLAQQFKKSWAPPEPTASHQPIPESDNVNLDLSRMNGSEEDKIAAMMMQSTQEYDPTNYSKVRGASQIGEVPASYRCYKCHKGGHWIKNCPVVPGKDAANPHFHNHFKNKHDAPKRTTGIPRTFIREPETEAPSQSSQNQTIELKEEIPEDLICSICKDIFVDAVMIPCCGSSFCDECVRTALLESEDNECPQTDCKEKGTSPNSLIPNRFLRNSVNTFQNETGYNKMRLSKKKASDEAEAAASEQPQFSEENSNASAGDAVEESNEAENGGETIGADISEENNNEAEASNGVESSGNGTADNTVEKDEIEAGEIKDDEKDSDDDNITVTVPPAHLQSWGPPFRGHHRRHHHHDSEYHNVHSHESRERVATPTFDEKDEKHEDSNDGYRYREKPHHHKPMMHSGGNQHQEEHRSGEQMSNYPQVSQSMGSGPDNSMAYSNISMPPNVGYHQNQPPSQMHQVPMHGQQYPPQQYPAGAPPYPGPPMNMRQPIRYDQHGYGPHMRPQMRPSGNYPMHGGHHFIRQRHIAPNNSTAHVAAAVTQDIQQQFGTGIIDDPLEAFNRIMREKELRRERNRRSPAPSTFERKRDYSPKNRSPDNHRKSPDDRNERNRGRSNDRHSPERERRRARSSSYNSGSSRSFSRSRSRSRKRSTLRRRSRSRSHSAGRYGGQRRRENFQYKDNYREDRHRSPEKYNSQRGRGGYRGRSSRGGYYNNRNFDNRSDYQQGGHYQQHQKPNDYQYQNQQPQQGQYVDQRYPQAAYDQSQQLHENRNLNSVPVKPANSPIMHTGRSQYEPHSTTSDPIENYEPPPPGFETLTKEEAEENFQYYQQAKKAEDDKPKVDTNEPPGTEMEGKKFIGDEENLHKHKNRSRSKDKMKEKHKESSSKKSHSSRSEKKVRESSSEDGKRDKKAKDKKKHKKSKEAEKKKSKKDKKERRERDKDKEKKHHDVESKSEMESKSEKKEDSAKDASFTENKTPEIEEKAQRQLVDSFDDGNNTPDTMPMEVKEQPFINEVLPPPKDVTSVANIVHLLNPTKETATAKDEEWDEERALNRGDSVLDIYNNIDFEENEVEDVPELSKWERDDMLAPSLVLKTGEDVEGGFEERSLGDEKVTSEVIKRAENAIFARAINAIRPLEIKKISQERQKLYDGSAGRREETPQPIEVSEMQNIKLQVQNVQITVNSNDEGTRSVEVRVEEPKKAAKPSPMRSSVKDRLGSKVSDKKRSQSKTPPPPKRKIQSETAKVSVREPKKQRSRSKERSSFKPTVEKARPMDNRYDRKNYDRMDQKRTQPDPRDSRDNRDNREMRDARDSRDVRKRIVPERRRTPPRRASRSPDKKIRKKSPADERRSRKEEASSTVEDTTRKSDKVEKHAEKTDDRSKNLKKVKEDVKKRRHSTSVSQSDSESSSSESDDSAKHKKRKAKNKKKSRASSSEDSRNSSKRKKVKKNKKAKKKKSKK